MIQETCLCLTLFRTTILSTYSTISVILRVNLAGSYPAVSGGFLLASKDPLSFSLHFLPGYSWFCSTDGWAMLVFFPQTILTIPTVFLFCLSRAGLNSLNRKLFYECIGITWKNSCIHIVSLGQLQTLFQGSFILGDS